MSRSVSAAAALWFVAVLISPVLGGQSKPDSGSPAFDVVSIKPSKSDSSGTRIGWQPGGRWIMMNMSAAGLIRSAYPTKVSDLLGAPGWVTSDRYDVEARATFEPTIDQRQTMLRTLLADRFKLAAHYESQERPIYNLVVARADGRLGPQIRRIDIDCATYKSPAPARGVPEPPITDLPPCAYRMSASKTISIVSGGRSMESLADSIASHAGRPILDRTGLTGYYAFTLESFGGNEGLSIFTALQEQLGLKLEPARGPVDVLVIDHIERPTEN